MTLLEQLINASGEIVIISKDVNDNYVVHFNHCDVAFLFRIEGYFLIV